MKKLVILFVLILAVGHEVLSQESNKIATIKTTLVVKGAEPFLNLMDTGFGGTLALSSDSLAYYPKPCSELSRKLRSWHPCAQDYIKPMQLSLEDIAKVRRRNSMLFFPNRIYIDTKDRRSYIFLTYKRKAIIDQVKRYQADRVALSSLH